MFDSLTLSGKPFQTKGPKEKPLKFCNHKKIVLPDSLSFDLPPASQEDINKIVKSLNANKATGLDRIPPQLRKLSANVVDQNLTSIINHDISRSYFSDKVKNAFVRPIYKNKYKQNKENYPPVSILNGFSKVY